MDVEFRSGHTGDAGFHYHRSGHLRLRSRGFYKRQTLVLLHDKQVTMEQFGQRIMTGMVVARTSTLQLESRLEEAVRAGARVFQKRKAAESPSVTKADQRCRGCAAHAALPTARPQKGANSCPLTTTSSYLSQTSSFSLSFSLVLSLATPFPCVDAPSCFLLRYLQFQPSFIHLHSP